MSSDGKYLITGSKNGSFKVFDLESKQQLYGTSGGSGIFSSYFNDKLFKAMMSIQ